MSSRRIVVVGGGAAGFFAAIACAETDPNAEVVILEKGPQFLAKVRISGGGRCNVTHACFDPRELSERYPRGGRALIAPFLAFQPRDTIAWFEARGVPLKTERDGRMFPATDSSETIIECLTRTATALGVRLRNRCAVDAVLRQAQGGFLLHLSTGESVPCSRLLLATGGCRTPAAAQLGVSLGHALEPPVPSLFTFEVPTPWLRQLQGVTLPSAEVSVPAAKLRERGALLITHWGLSGPVVLRLSAWGARALHALNYQFSVCVNWLPGMTPESILGTLQSLAAAHPSKRVSNTPVAPLTARLWEQLVIASAIPPTTQWNQLSRAGRHALVQQLSRSELPVIGKSTNKDEFVTCGGIPLREVDFRTMQSKVCPGLFFAGELLDIDAITGGFNFQAAWTTGWIAGRAIAADTLAG